MDCARILLSLPSELAEIKRQLIQQQNELKLIGRRLGLLFCISLSGEIYVVTFFVFIAGTSINKTYKLAYK